MTYPPPLAAIRPRIAVPVTEEIQNRVKLATEHEMARFRDATNTLVLNGSQEAGVRRGKMGEAAVASYFDFEWDPEPGRSYNLMTGSGKTIDVKTTKPKGWLLYPRGQLYKPGRVDLIMLAYWAGFEDEVILHGWVWSEEFEAYSTSDTSVPWPALSLAPSMLRPLTIT